MPRVAIQNIEPGMVLEDDVRDINGRTLLAKGQPVLDKHLTIFRMWGVTDVAIADGTDEATSAPDPPGSAAMRKIALAIRPAFVENDLTHPAVAEIFRQAVLFRSRQPSASERSRPGPSPGRTIQRIPNGAERRRKLVRRDIQLPEIPSLIFKLNDTIADPFSSADDIARIISKSPGLSALLLRIVNSAFYGFPSRIDSLSRAVAIIGSKEVTALAVGITTMQIFKDIPPSVFDMQAFTHHSLACGIFSRILAASANIRNTEQMFVSGLLHDIGRLVVCRYMPDAAAVMMVPDERSSLYEREKALLGFRHTDIAADLFKKWNFPMALEQNVVYHHRPNDAQDPVKAGIVHLADMIVHSLGAGKSGEWRVPKLDPAAWAALRLSPESLATIIPQAIEHLSFMLTVFLENSA